MATLVEQLVADGYRVVGPTVRDGAVVLDEVDSVDDLARGVTDEQGPGTYRLVPDQSGRWFATTVGPQSWKRWLYPPRERLWRAVRTPDGFRLEPDQAAEAPLAFVGVRPCDLAAMAVHDRVLAVGEHADEAYAARREAAVVVVVECGRSSPSCFCASMATGPSAEAGYDLALCELTEPEHRFVVRSGSARGDALLAAVPSVPADDDDLAARTAALAEAAGTQVRHVDPTGLPELLARRIDSAHWDHLAERCLACGCCAMACPTCFCHTTEDTTDLAGTTAERWRRWDTCYTIDFSYLHGGSVRSSTRARYRQWLTHKLGTWVEQFGVPGCVGCGRCITWCPVGIDITAEVAAIRALDAAVAGVRGAR